jgi:hypothetical protein
MLCVSVESESTAAVQSSIFQFFRVQSGLQSSCARHMLHEEWSFAQCDATSVVSAVHDESELEW